MLRWFARDEKIPGPENRKLQVSYRQHENGHLIYIMRQKEAAPCFYMVRLHVLYNESAVFFLIMVYNTGAIFA